MMVPEERSTGGAVMADVLDVAAFILRAQGPMTAMKLQKLCYYAYGHHLAWEEKQLFPERFEAWANGPVCRELYEVHRGRLQIRLGQVQQRGGRASALTGGEAESVALVLETYGDLSAHQLSEMTHHETPWLKARERAGADPLDRSREQLRDEEMFEFFDALTSEHAAS
jgi:uncharacterized phage-associated protein